MYKKRPGTSGIRGHLYETKLISLLLFRAKHDKRIKEFHLATNVDNIGAFDDICFKATVQGFDRPLAVFIQAKHRENDQSISLNNTRDLAKYFDSFLQIRRAFQPANNDALFEGVFDETECLFVMYTTARSAVPDGHAGSSGSLNFLNDLISTGVGGRQPACPDEQVEFLCKMAVKEELSSLAVQVARIFSGEGHFQQMLDNVLVLRYHVILAQRVFKLSSIQPEGYRNAVFREDFFTTDDENLMFFRDVLYSEILKKRKVDHKEVMEYLKLYFFKSPSPGLLSKLIGSVVSYNNGKLQFVDGYKISKEEAVDLKKKLNKVYVSQATVLEAVEEAAESILLFLQTKLPTAFGNTDMTIRGNDAKINKRLDHLTSTICDLLHQSDADNIITLNESLGKGFLQVNGGIASAVGNLLVFDETTKLLKFTENSELLGDLAKRLFDKLTCKVHNLHEYRFVVKVIKFPKLTFDCSEHENVIVRDFLNKLLFYTNQADEHEVEQMLKSEIEDQQESTVYNLKVRADAIFLKYHDEVQKWWMSPDVGRYLTERSETYDDTMKNIVQDPLMSVINMIYRNKIRNVDYTFKEDAVSSLNLKEQLSTTVIVSESVVLTVAKVIQNLKDKDHVVLDLEYISNLPATGCSALCAEFVNASDEKILIFVCENAKYSRNWCKALENIGKAVLDQKTVVVTNKSSVAIIQQYFTQADTEVIDDNNNFTDMTDESQKTVLNNAKVIFQGEEVSLLLIVDDESVALIEGDVLNRIIRGETIAVGKSIRNSSYDEIKHLYVDRRVRRGKKPNYPRHIIFIDRNLLDKVVETLDDVMDDVVLITAKPGMGKSTLLTHLALNTKELNPKIWIVRINLLEYSREFSKWQENKTVIDTLESLHFICQVILSEKQGKVNKVTIALGEANGVVHLRDCSGDESTVFELKLFLHFYNRDKVIFLFDGFDEICPHYTNEVLALLRTVRCFPRPHRMWVASRSYNIIKSILQREFGTSYEMEPFSVDEQDEYLDRFWNSNLRLKDLDGAQLNNMRDFVNFMAEKELLSFHDFRPRKKLQYLPLYEIYFSALKYIKNNFVFFPFVLNKNLKIVIQLGLGNRGLFLLDCNGENKEINTMCQFVSTPLHLFLVADYFQNQMKDINKVNKWNLDINIFSIYERFLETKLKRIRFQEKNKIDIYIPDNIMTYEKERIDFIDKHKILAAYALFHRKNHALFSRKQLKEIKETIKLFKRGGEKTGVIFNVTKNIPTFIHMTFTEYFAVDYVCDLVKNETCNDKLTSMINFIFDVMFIESPANVLNIMDSKIQLDEALFRVFLIKEKDIFDLLMEQSKGYITDEFDYDGRYYTETKYNSALNRAVSENLTNFLSFFISIHTRYINKHNIDNFITLIYETQMTTSALAFKCDEFLNFALDVVRKINKKKIHALFNIKYFVSIFTNYENMSNEEIIQLHSRSLQLNINPVHCPPHQFDNQF